MKRNATFLAAAAVAMMTFAGLPGPAQAANNIAECNDGTVFDFGPDDAITAEVACANHGGVKPKSPFKAKLIQKNGATPAPGKSSVRR